MLHSILFTTASLLLFTACSKKKDEPTPTPPTTGSSPAAPVASPKEPAPSGGTTDIDLSPAGEKWKGWTIKGPADTKVADNGAGGIGIVMGSFGFEVTSEPDIKLQKDGLKSGLEFSKGKLTYSVEQPDRIEYTTETPVEGAAPIKGYGFSYIVNKEAKVGCSAMLDDEKQIAAAKAACDSLAKK